MLPGLFYLWSLFGSCSASHRWKTMKIFGSYFIHYLSICNLPKFFVYVKWEKLQRRIKLPILPKLWFHCFTVMTNLQPNEQIQISSQLLILNALYFFSQTYFNTCHVSIKYMQLCSSYNFKLHFQWICSILKTYEASIFFTWIWNWQNCKYLIQ